MARFRTTPLRRTALAVLTTAAAGLAAAPGALAGAPAAVRVTVEGAARTLISTRTLTTTTTAIERGGATCPGTSAGGALDVATGGAWTAAPDAAAGPQVDSVLGELHPAGPADPRRWVLMVNSIVWPGSPCAIELGAGDSLVFYPGTVPPAAIGSGCRTTGRDGACGSPDRTGPVATITSVKEKQVFRRGDGPLLLAGTVAPDPAGLRDVRLRITRSRGTRCHYYSGIEETFLRSRSCGADGPQFFSIGAAAAWSYLLPRRLTPGRYTLDVEVQDKLGNVATPSVRGRDRIVFTVR